MWLSITSCLIALFAAIALFVHGLFIQAAIEADHFSPIGLFSLSLGCFAIATYYGWKAQTTLLANDSRSNNRT